MRDAALVMEKLSKLELMSVSSLEAEYQRLGLPLGRVAMQRKELEAPLKEILIWHGLPLDELQNECQQRQMSSDLGYLGGGGPEQKDELIQRLLATLAASAFESRGIPVRRLGSIKVASRVAAEWDRLEYLNTKGVAEESSKLGLPAEECLEWHGRGEVLSRLKQLKVWNEFPLAELQQECIERGGHIGDLIGADEKKQCQQLADRLLLDVFAEFYDKARGLSIKEFDSFFAAEAVIQRWHQLAQMDTDELMEEFLKTMGIHLLGIKTESGRLRPELERRLRDAALLSNISVTALRRVCHKRGLSAQIEAQTDLQAQQQELLGRVLVSLCADAYHNKGIDAKSLGSVAASSKLLDYSRHLEEMALPELEAEYGLLHLPAHVVHGCGELRHRLFRSAYWQLLPLAELHRECTRLGLPLAVRQRSKVTIAREIAAAHWGLTLPSESRESPSQSGHPQMSSPQPTMGSTASSAGPRVTGVRNKKAYDEIPGKAKTNAGVAATATAANAATAAEAASASGTRARAARKSAEPQTSKPSPPQPPKRPIYPAPMLKHLKVLELGLDADRSDIKKAYHRLALKHHPDKHTVDMRDTAAEAFRTVIEAYEALNAHLNRLSAGKPLN